MHSIETMVKSMQSKSEKIRERLYEIDTSDKLGRAEKKVWYVKDGFERIDMILATVVFFADGLSEYDAAMRAE